MRIPLLPAPILDETFGSWFGRAADALHTEPESLVNSLLAEEGLKSPRSYDLDVSPPEGLIDSLVKRSALRLSELTRLTVPPGGSTLPPHCRDAYCPECLKHDREEGVTYIRRSWLDAWTFICERHDCLLGEFNRVEYRATTTHRAAVLFASPLEAYRRNPSVSPVRLPSLKGDSTDFSHWISLLRRLSGTTRRAHSFEYPPLSTLWVPSTPESQAHWWPRIFGPFYSGILEHQSGISHFFWRRTPDVLREFSVNWNLVGLARNAIDSRGRSVHRRRL